MNLKSILNKNSIWTHMELEFDELGIAIKLVNYSLRPKLLECFD
jgi:hypothetical protein